MGRLLLLSILLCASSIYAQQDCPTNINVNQEMCQYWDVSDTERVYATVGELQPKEGVLWYYSATDGEPLDKSESLVTGTYYAGDLSGSCTSRVAVDVVVHTKAVAGMTTQIYICFNDAPFDLQKEIRALDDGRASSPIGNFVPALKSGTKMFTPGDDEARTYMYVVPPGEFCQGDDTRITVFVAPAPDPGLDGTAEILSTAGLTDLYQFLKGTPETEGSWDTDNGSTFNPAVDKSGVYTYTVRTTTPIGGGGASIIDQTCTASSSVNVTLIEVTDQGKVTLCHKGKTIEVNHDAVLAHEAHGDRVGECSPTPGTIVAPNPSRGEFNLSNENAMINKVRILNFYGGLVKEFSNRGKASSIKIDITGARPGIYFAEVITTNGKEVLRLVKE